MPHASASNPIGPIPDQRHDEQPHRAALEAEIRHHIEAAGGRIGFDRFMELALYAPGLGYYVAGAPKLGAEGDFVTAPEISPLFGRCLAQACGEALAALGGGDLLEFGAGSGRLAAELLTTLEAQDDRKGPLPNRYLILEPSPDLAALQRVQLARQAPQWIDRCEWLQRLPETFEGVILANEVLDAMPVHRFCIDDDQDVLEMLVTASDSGFSEIRAPASPALAAAVAQLQAQGLATEPGFCSELNLRLAPWTQAVAAPLRAGLLLIIDYGYPRAELYQAERHQGTLMCHHRHQSHTDVYSHLGQQDITAHVDFTALAEAGRAAGLDLAGYTTQSSFLIGCGIDQIITKAAGDDPLALMHLSAGAKQLLLPSAMGERFQVLGLSRGLDTTNISGFRVRDLRDRL
jgi:SAM-dependent MidA family methyltransferase